jgi:Sugar-transfer associated ATP-grasp
LEFQAQLAATGEPYIVTAAVEQHPEMASFFPETVNTVRVLMMREPGGEAFVADAVLRLGTSSSGGVDNFSKGGLSFPSTQPLGRSVRGDAKRAQYSRTIPTQGRLSLGAPFRIGLRFSIVATPPWPNNQASNMLDGTWWSPATDPC